MKATFGHQTRAPTELINDNTVTLNKSITNVSSDSDSKSLLSVQVLLERS